VHLSWITVIFSAAASAYLTAALIYAFIWWRQRNAWAQLLFAFAALAAVGLVGCDLAEMHAESPAQFAAALRWTQLLLWVIVLALAGFVLLYFRAGKMWLFWSVCALRTLSLFLNYLTGQNLNYREITSLQSISFLGESVSIAKGVPNPWMLVGHLSLLVLVVFVADAALAVWRRGERRLAVIVGGSIVFFVLAGSGQAMLICWGIAPWPLTPSLFSLGIIAAMIYEVSDDALRAVQLGRDLRAKDQQITLAAEAANMGFWFRDFAREDFWACNQWRSLFGFTSSEALYMDNFLQRLHPNDRETTLQALESAYQGDGSYQTEHRVVLPGGQVRWIACQGRLELGSDHQPLRLQGVSLDITRRKAAELEAQAHRNEASHLLRAASVGELSTAMAHELKQPLAAILSNAQAAQLYLAQDNIDLHEVREILGDIVADDKRAADVIDRVHVLMKKDRWHPQPLEANHLIRDVLRLMHHELEAHSVRVVTELTADLPSIRGDRVQLQQVLINLILNAVDAMSQPAKNDPTLTLRSGRMGDSVQISVVDTGHGIPAGVEETIFESYYTTKSQGLGLGLSLSRSILIAHGGRLWAENQATGGAAFYCTMPEWKGDTAMMNAGDTSITA
jgi:two-component system, LuxR family, sensor kinase FixL